MGVRRLAQGRDFGADGNLREEVVRLDETQARGLMEQLQDAAFSVRTVDEKPYSRKPSAPFMTSTLQQEASRKLGFTAQTTMRVAQRLYEQGYITYMRTDSTTLSEVALTAARKQARELYGADHVPEAPRRYDRKVKNAQEAHEAIRPSGETFRLPSTIAGELDRDEAALYGLIWMRTVASQMADARGQTVSVGSPPRRPPARTLSSGFPARRSRSPASWPRTRKAATTSRLVTRANACHRLLPETRFRPRSWGPRGTRRVRLPATRRRRS